MKRAKKRNATTNTWRMVATMVAPLWMLPALAVNVAWAEGALSPWNVAAVASIAAAALFAAAACQANTRLTTLAFAIAATLLTLSNSLTAFTSASHRTNENRDHRQAVIATIERQEQQRSQWSKIRNSAALIVGEKPAATIQAQIDQTIAAHARRWVATDQCDPKSVTARASMAFCGQVAALRGQLAAATRRDALDAQIERQDNEAANLNRPSGEPFVVAIVGLTAAVGLPLSKTVADALPEMRDALRALTLELIAALGPAAWLMLWNARETQLSQSPLKRSAGRTSADAASPSNTQDHIAAFIAARINRDESSAAKAGEVWLAWRAWCAERSLDPGTQKRFGQAIARSFKRDRNGGRPRYLGAGIRPETTAALQLRHVHVLPFVARRTT